MLAATGVPCRETTQTACWHSPASRVSFARVIDLFPALSSVPTAAPGTLKVLQKYSVEEYMCPGKKVHFQQLSTFFFFFQRGCVTSPRAHSQKEGGLGFELGLLMAQMVKNLPVNAGDPRSIPGSGRFPGEGNGNPLQYTWLENPMDREARVGYSPWVAQSQTQLSN